MCLTPILIKNKSTHQGNVVPCGKCAACVKRRISAWSFRLMQEEKVSTSAHFITLTYDTTHVPITQNGFMSISKRHVQLFLKRLRKAHSGSQASGIKYYCVGEYGGKTKRPHYHVLLFNCDIEHVEPSWKWGQVHYGNVCGASVGYTLKYMSKPSKIPLHRNDDRVPEFSLMSKNWECPTSRPQWLPGTKWTLSNECIATLQVERKSPCPGITKTSSMSLLNVKLSPRL